MGGQHSRDIDEVASTLKTLFVSADATLKAYERRVRATVNTATDSITLTLPHPYEVDQRSISIHAEIANSKTITVVDPTGAMSNIVLDVDGDFLVLFSDGEYYHTQRIPSVAALTDSSTGTPADTLSALTNIDTLTDSTTGSADNTVDPAVAPTEYTAVVNMTDPVTKAEGEAVSAALATLENEVTALVTVVNNNFKEVTDQVITQKAFNTSVTNNIASLAAKVNALIAAIANS